MIETEQYKQNIPIELRQYKQWLWFKKIRRVDLKRQGKNTKASCESNHFKLK